ncbi:sigma factor [Streptomyces sp. NPDC006422]|uniref:sigma factor n=1 Tax=unclassified Streptomyces TaxID=2593676 RepID=UPI0033AF495B
MTDGPAAAPIPPAATEGGLSPAAYARIYEAEQPRLVAYARSLTGNPWLADDLVAEAHFRVWRRLAAGHDVDNVAAYLTTTVRNLAASAGRGAARETPLDPHTGIEPVQVSTAAYGSGAYGDQDPATRASEVDLLSQVLGQLPERWVKALWLSEAEGQPLEAVGRGIGAGSGATAVLLHRAREGMRQAFLRTHPGAPADPACEGYWERMPAYVRGNASPRQSEKLLAHVDDCDDCRKRLTVLLSANDRLPALVGPALLIFVLGGAGKFLLPLAVGAGAGAAGAAGSASSGHGAGSGLLHGVRHVLTGGSKTQGAVAGVLGVSVAGAAVAAGLVLTSNGGDTVPPQRSAAIQSEKGDTAQKSQEGRKGQESEKGQETGARDSAPSGTSPSAQSSAPSSSSSPEPASPQDKSNESNEPSKEQDAPRPTDTDTSAEPKPDASDSPATPSTPSSPSASDRAVPPKESTPAEPSPTDTPSSEPTPTPTPTTEQPSPTPTTTEPTPEPTTPEPSNPAPSPSCTRWLGPIHICHIIK